MSAIDDFAALLELTEPMKVFLKEMRKEPAQLLGDICREYEATKQAVPDHYLQMVGHLGELAANILIAASLIKRQPGGTFALYVYEPTPEGIEQYQKLRAEGFYKAGTSLRKSV